MTGAPDHLSLGNFGQTRILTEKFEDECGYYVVVLPALPIINRGCGYPASTTFSELNILRPFLGTRGRASSSARGGRPHRRHQTSPAASPQEAPGLEQTCDERPKACSGNRTRPEAGSGSLSSVLIDDRERVSEGQRTVDGDFSLETEATRPPFSIVSHCVDPATAACAHTE